MGCAMCEYTGIEYEWDETAGPGYVEVPCPQCHGHDGQEPGIVTEGHDAATQAEIEAEGDKEWSLWEEQT